MSKREKEKEVCQNHRFEYASVFATTAADIVCYAIFFHSHTHTPFKYRQCQQKSSERIITHKYYDSWFNQK